MVPLTTRAPLRLGQGPRGSSDAALAAPRAQSCAVRSGSP